VSRFGPADGPEIIGVLGGKEAPIISLPSAGPKPLTHFNYIRGLHGGCAG